MPTTIAPHRSKGRPRFDRPVALDRALGVFWRLGFEPASIAELCAAMEINPPSLYAAFGSKAQLFMEAVEHYEHLYWDAAWERMAHKLDVYEAVAGFFHDAAGILTSQHAPCGCLVVLAATNVSADSQAVNEALKGLRKDARGRFLARIRRAVSDAQLPAQTDADGLAAALNVVLEGLSLQTRDGAGRDELSRITAIAMAMLPAPRR